MKHTFTILALAVSLSAGISADAIADTDPAWPLQLGCSRLIMNDKMSDQCRILTCLFAFSTLRTI